MSGRVVTPMSNGRELVGIANFTRPKLATHSKPAISDRICGGVGFEPESCTYKVFKTVAFNALPPLADSL